MRPKILPKLMAALALAALPLRGAAAVDVQDFFHLKPSKLWSVSGSATASGVGATCWAENRRDDGSYLHVSFDVDTGLFFLWIKDRAWRLSPKSRPAVRLSVFGKDGVLLKGGNTRGTAMTPQDLDLNEVDPDVIMPLLAKASTLRFTLPDGSDVEAGIDDWDAVAKALDGCRRAWASMHGKS